MAKAREKKPLTKKAKWLRYVIMLLFGGGSGVGGWQMKDHPVLQRIFTRVTGHEPGDGPLTKQDAIRAVAGVLAQADAYRKAGDFNVKITSVKLDPYYFKQGHTLDIQVRLIKRDAAGHESTVWDSKSFGEHALVVGSGELKTDWSDHPINVSWAPGDGFVFEVWNRKSLFDKKWFEWSSTSDQVFPLRSGAYVLSLAERGSSTSNPKGSQIVLESKPKGGSDSHAASVAREIDDTVRIK